MGDKSPKDKAKVQKQKSDDAIRRSERIQAEKDSKDSLNGKSKK